MSLGLFTPHTWYKLYAEEYKKYCQDDLSKPSKAYEQLLKFSDKAIDYAIQQILDAAPTNLKKSITEFSPTDFVIGLKFIEVIEQICAIPKFKIFLPVDTRCIIYAECKKDNYNVAEDQSYVEYLKPWLVNAMQTIHRENIRLAFLNKDCKKVNLDRPCESTAITEEDTKYLW